MDSRRSALKSTSKKEFESALVKWKILQHLLQDHGVDGSPVASCVFIYRKFQHLLRYSKHPERQFLQRAPQGWLMQLSPDRLFDYTRIFKCPIMRRTQKIMADFTLGFLEKGSLVRCCLKVKVLFLSVDSQMPADREIQKMKILLCKGDNIKGVSPL